MIGILCTYIGCLSPEKEEQLPNDLRGLKHELIGNLVVKSDTAGQGPLKLEGRVLYIDKWYDLYITEDSTYVIHKK